MRSRVRGQNVIEYGLLLAAVGVLVLLGVGTFGQMLHAWLQHLAARVTTMT